MTTIGTIELIAKIDTSQYKKGGGEIDRVNKNIEGSSEKASSKTSNSWSKVAKVGFAAVATAAIAVGAVITKNIDNAIKRVDTLNNSARTFANMGFGAKEVDKAMKALDQSIRGLPTSLDSAVRGVQLLAGSTNDVGKAQKIFSALNNAVIGFGGNAEMVEGAIIQLSQAFSNGKVDAQTWNSLIQNGLGPALNALAREMGITTGELKSGLSEGTVSVKEFQDALITMNTKGGGGMKSFEKISKDATSGISTGWQNMQTAITRGIADIIQSIGSERISGAISGFGSLIEGGLGKIADTVPKIINGITKQFSGENIKEGDFKSFGEKVGSSIANGLNSAIGAINISMDSIRNWFSGIDWGKLGVDIGRQSVAFLIGFGIGLLDFDMGAVFKTLAENWLPLLIGALSILFAPAKLLGPLAKIVRKIPFGKTFIKFFINPLRNLGEPIRSAVSDLFSGLGGRIGTIFKGIGTVLKTIGQILIAPFRLLIEGIANRIRLLPLTFSNIIQTIGDLLRGFVSVVKTIFTGIWTVITTILRPLTAFFRGLFSGIWNNIKGIFSSTGNFFRTMFQNAWQAVKNIWSGVSGWFQTRWNAIKGIFKFVTSFFGDIFRGAYNRVISAFSGLIGWFRGLWNRIVNLFGNVGTSVGNAIGRTFKSTLNAVLRGAVGIINGFVRAINSAVGTINKIPKVNISTISELSVPQLAKGGIITSPTLAMVGEGNESEAVIPLSKLDKMIESNREEQKPKQEYPQIVVKLSHSPSAMRQAALDTIELVNQVYRAKGLPEIGVA